MKSLLLVLLALLLLGSCDEKNKRKQLQSNSFPILKDLSETIKVNTLFDEFEYISLETTEKSIFGWIDKLIIHNNQFYILDRAKTKKVLVFTLEGKFLRSIGRVGKGPGEYTNLEDFTIAPQSDNVVLLAFPSRVITYDPTGEFISEKRLSSSVSLWNIASYKSGYVCSTNHFSPPQSKDAFLIYKFDMAFNLQGKLLEALPQQVGMPSLIHNPLINCKDEITYFDFFKSSIHLNITNSDFKTIRFDFNEKETPIDAFVHPQVFFTNQQEYNFFTDAFFAHNIIYTTFINRGKQHVLIMDLANNKNTTHRVEGWFPEFLFSQNDFIYSAMESSRILRGHNFFNAKKTSKYPIEDLSNPVILKFKTKL